MGKVVNLASKYRPRTFEDVSEQDSVRIILENQIKTGNIKHAYLFCGGAGTGKTTTARIVADMMNQGQGQPMELDCASHNGVDDMRAIQEECKYRPIGSKYKIFIMDECFEGDSIVTTNKGNKKIKDIKPGDLVATSSGYNKVNNVFKKSVPNNRLIDIYLSNGNKIVTTVNHLFMTTEGWVEASKLEQGDELIVYNKLSKLWQRDSYRQKREEVLQSAMLQANVEQKQGNYQDIYKEMCNLWKQFCCKIKQQEYKNLFTDMQEQVNIAVREDDNEFRIWDAVKETVIKKNDSNKSDAQESEHKEDDYYERIEWNTSSIYKGTRWKWQIYRSSNEIIQQFRKFLDIGVSNTNTNKKEEQSKSLSYIIQSRPWLSYEDDSCRSGWQITQYEKWYTTGYKEAEQIGRVRVESIAFHKSANNGESELCDNNYTEMFDLSVDDDCTYFVNDVLVHNCHMLTNQAWNSMLKILEEPPEYVIFLFCTTDPQKIIGTILSRVQRFNFSKISTQGIENRLKYIIESENNERESANLQPIIYEPEAVDYIARLARGGMRDSITTLEKCLDYSQHLTLQNVIKVTSGGVTEQTMQQLLYYVLIKDSKSALLLFNDIYMSGIDISLFVKLYTEFLQNCVKFILTENSQIVTLSDIVIKWLLANQSQLDNIRTHLLSCLKLNTRYSSEDLRVLVESWLIQECN